jgi:RNA methyltransferase, TrmH family
LPPAVRARSHPAARRLKEIRDGADKSLIFLEGPRLAEEIFRSPLKPKEVFHTGAFAAGPHAGLLDRLKAAGAPPTTLDDQVMSFVSDLRTPPGIVVLAERPVWDFPSVLQRSSPPLFVLLDRLQLPQNAGAVLRAAEACGAHAVFALSGGADLLGPKTLRASAGSALRLPALSVPSFEDVFSAFAAAGVICAAADPRGKTDYKDWDWTRPSCLVLGSEGGGLEGGPAAALETVRIPMREPVESLNVAVAAGIFLQEAFRQRQGEKA